ncbi:hypothetical protein GCM10008992_31540 [Halorubrum aquaticum]
MFGIAGVASAGYEYHQQLSPEVNIEEGILFQALFVALLAAMIGTFTGLEAARREQAFTDLQLERDKFSKMFENIPEPAAEYTVEDDEMILTRANDTFVEQFDISPPVSVTEFNQIAAKLANDDDVQELDNLAIEGEEINKEVQRETVTGRRWFKLHSAPHEDGGFILYLDITDQHLRGQQIQVLSRVLRHNLRNNLTVAAGFANEVAKKVNGEELEQDTEKICSAIDEILEISEQTRSIYENIENDPPKPERTEITGIAQNRIMNTSDSFEDIDLTLDSPDESWALAHQTLGVVIDLLLESLREHNDQRHPQISVTVESVAEGEVEYATICMTDNGTGLPEDELIPLRVGEEPSQLQHAQDVDLWMANWFVDQFGGMLQAQASRDEGTTFIIKLKPTN